MTTAHKKVCEFQVFREYFVGTDIKTISMFTTTQLASGEFLTRCLKTQAERADS